MEQLLYAGEDGADIWDALRRNERIKNLFISRNRDNASSWTMDDLNSLGSQVRNRESIGLIGQWIVAQHDSLERRCSDGGCRAVGQVEKRGHIR